MLSVRPRRLAALAVAGLVVFGACGRTRAPKPGDEAPSAAAPAVVADPAPSSTPLSDGSYQGRPIAQTCSYLGADWLDRPERDEREQPDRVLDALHLDPGATVADVGAGTGYFTVRLARRVARVHATDLQPEMLQLLSARLAREHLGNGLCL